jgi:aryl-alcohol dehydrogenase-like predicted oxidoreductase
MKYRKLGRTGFEVSEMAHGLWGMSGWSGSDDRESLDSLQLATDLGCNFFDTAWAYGEGKSDGLLGQILSRNASPSNPSKYQDVFPTDHVLKHADLIRKKLRVDTVDLLQFHVWDDSWTDEPEFRSTVEKLRHDGIIRHFGLSLNRWEPENGLKALRTGSVDAVQVIHNIFDQAPEDKLFPVCQDLNIGVMARVPLDEGSLGGKMTLETKFPKGDWRAMYFGPKNLPPTIERVEKLKAVLPPALTLPQMALRYILSFPAVSTIIVGMRKLEHVRQNIAASDVGPLDAALLRKLKDHRWDRKPEPWAD